MKKEKWGTAAALFCFFICAAMTAYYLIAGYGAYLDSDMASELALASHLAQEGKLISPDWMYSTEVRLLSTQLVFTPLMMLFPDNWQLVRTAGCLILMAVMASSTYFCARSLGAKKSYAWLFAGFSISAWSVVYSQMILIGGYYVPHAVLTNLLVGMTARWLSCTEHKKRTLLFTGILVLGAFMGASSSRYLFCAIIPMGAAAVWMFAFPGREREQLRRTRTQISDCAAICLICLVSLLGFAAGQKVLRHLYAYGGVNHTGTRLFAFTTEELPAIVQDVIGGLYRLLGYWERSILISVHGVISTGVLLLPVLAGILAVRALKKAQSSENKSLHFGVLTMIMCVALTAGSFIFAHGLYLNRYWIPMITLSLSVLAACISSEGNRVFAVLAALMMSGIVLGVSAMQIDESMTNPEIDEEDWALADYLMENDMDFGYATFWHANYVTELTDGQIEVVGVNIKENENGQGVPIVDTWLEKIEDQGMNRPDDPVFMLVLPDEAEWLEDFFALSGAERREDAEGPLEIWVIDSQRAFFEAGEKLKAI